MIRSAHVDRFNHDEDAAGYDADVLNEADPIRTGYQGVLGFTVDRVAAAPGPVLELGSGTGNLTVALLERAAVPRVVAVDVSREMTGIASDKLAARSGGLAGRVQFALADLLEFCTAAEAGNRSKVESGPFAHIVSSYAIHHLTTEERSRLFSACYALLEPGGRLLVGDLMFENAAAESEILDSYRLSGRAELAEEIAEEFFWQVDLDRVALATAGFSVTFERFSELSWCLEATRVDPPGAAS